MRENHVPGTVQQKRLIDTVEFAVCDAFSRSAQDGDAVQRISDTSVSSRYVTCRRYMGSKRQF
jgi:hypothetical protein